LQNQILLCLVVRLGAVFERNKRVHGLACQFIVDTYHGGFGNGICG
jgi:hypothetical protein